jgi:acyl transferase domain-containing protein
MSFPTRSYAKEKRLGYVFTGQGAQWHGMGRELLFEAAFRESFRRSQSYLEELGCSWSLIGRLTDQKYQSSIQEAQFSQTLTTAVQIALVDLFASLGTEPNVVVGHSSGEIAAAYAAGHISQATAITVSYYRGFLANKLEQTCATKCCMAAVGISYKDALYKIKLLEEDQSVEIIPGSLTVSCINSPSNVTISGPDLQISKLVDIMSYQKIFARKLRVGLGYHSPQMTIISSEYLSYLTNLEPGILTAQSRPVMVSSVTGTVIDAKEVCTGEYWVRNLVSPVNFLAAVQVCSSALKSESIIRRLDSGHTVEQSVDGWLEIGPHAALRGPIREILKFLPHEKNVTYCSALIRNKPALSTLLAAVGELFCHSFPVDLSQIVLLGLSPSQRNSLKVLPNLPKYQFNRSTVHWEEPQSNRNFRLRKHGNHDLMGTRISEPNALESQWKFIIKEDDMPWIRDHKVQGSAWYPAAGMIVMAIEAAKQLMEDRMPIAFELEDVTFPAPIMITSVPEGTEVRTHLSSALRGEKGETDYRFRIFLYKPDNSHEIVCSGTIRGDYGSTNPDVTDGKQDGEKALRVKAHFEATLASCTVTLSPEQMYQTCRDIVGLDYGREFQVLAEVHTHDSGKAVATVLPRDLDSTSSHTVHPTRLDGMFQLGIAALSAMHRKSTMVPTFLSRLWIPTSGFGHNRQPAEKGVAQIKSLSERKAAFDIRIVAGANALLRAEVTGLEVTAVSANTEPVASLASAPYISSHVAWKVDLDTLDVTELKGYCETARPGRSEPIDYFRNMDSLVYQFGARALREINSQGENIAQHMKKYAMWLDHHVNKSPDTSLLSDTELENICEAVRFNVRGQLHITIGQHLVQFLRGEEDPLQLIFAEEAKVTEFYRELMEDTTAVDPFDRYLDTLVHKDPGLKFLEVGAGTGSTTTVVLRAIDNPDVGTRFEEYIYTDISPSFLEPARAKFSAHKRMKYKVLDVEQDPVAQGFESGTCDVVVADNVLHATQDLQVTLRNIRKLLRPGGKLILKELSTPERFLTGFAFGLLPGWWSAREEERALSPLLSEDQWNELLREVGFSGVELNIPDNLSLEAHIWSIMISTATSSETVSSLSTQPPSPLPMIVLDSTFAIQKQIATELVHGFCVSGNPRLVSLAEASSISETEPKVHDFIFLNELGGSILRDIQGLDFSHLQKFLHHARTIVWIKQGGRDNVDSSPDHGISDGLLRVLRREHRNTVVSIRLEKAGVSSVVNILKIYTTTRAAVNSGSLDFEPEYQETAGNLYVNRLVRAKNLDEHVFKRTADPVLHQPIEEKKLKIGIRTRGLLDTIEFTEDQTFNTPLGHDEADVEVRAIGLNYRDCLSLLGRYNSDSIGVECSGVVRAIGKNVTHVKVRDRVLIGGEGLGKTYVRIPGRAVMRIPDTMTFEEAASIFATFCTAYYSIVKLSPVAKGRNHTHKCCSGWDRTSYDSACAVRWRRGLRHRRIGLQEEASNGHLQASTRSYLLLKGYIVRRRHYAGHERQRSGCHH